MPMGEDSIETVIWTGRFVQAWRDPASVRMVKRREVKSHLCGSARAKDPNVRQALIDQVGAPGLKASPGPTYGVTSHAWARSEEHTSELQSLMRISYAVFCLKKTKE